MATFLQDRRHLTVVTNQLETARLLARDPRKTVILVGGVLRVDGSAVTGTISQEVLKDLHITTAFVSCVGFSLEVGLMEADIQEAQFKEQVIRSAIQVVALIDSTKFGKVGLKPFAVLEQIDHIVSDDGIPDNIIKTLKQAHVNLTICGEHTVQSLTPHDQQVVHNKIGFANLSEKIPFAVDVRRGLERAAKSHNNIDLIVADNDLSGAKAIQVADRFIQQEIDLMIEYQIDEAVGNLLMNRFQQRGIPVIAVDIPIIGATYCGVDHYQTGLIAGEALGSWIKRHWQGKIDYLIILEEKRAGPVPAARIQGQIQGLEGQIDKRAEDRVLFLDSGNTTEQSYKQTLKTLKMLPAENRLAFICFNDDAALGALAALRELGRESQAAIVGQGADRRIREEIRKGSPAIVGSTAFMPEHYGEKIIDLAQKILKNEQVPPAVYVDHVFIDAGNIDDFYADEY